MPRPSADAVHPFRVALTAVAVGLALAAVGASGAERPSATLESFERWLVAEAPPAILSDLREQAGLVPADALGGPLFAAAALADRRVEELAALPIEGGGAGPPRWLGSLPVEVASSIRLAVAERLYFGGRYDAALVWLDGLKPEYVYSEALLAYLRCVAAHGVVDDPRAREGLAELQPLKTQLGPARRWVVDWVSRELAKDEARPIDLVERRMRDAHRRLAGADASDATVERQEAIVAELDKLIKALEEQAKQAQQAAQQAGGAGTPSSSPAEDSKPSDLKGPGDVDRKRVVAGGEWGALPPAERERLAQGIAREFPAHYRRLIEEYFKTLADPDAAATVGRASEGEPAPSAEER
ncbi:MAG: hypothetical protein ACRCT8_06530 [Lacipirellulaceae bacterium]